jgi:predicted membrane protein
VALARQQVGVDQHAVALDAVQRLAAAHLQVVDEAQAGVAFQLGPQRQVHVQRLVGVLAGVFGGLVDGTCWNGIWCAPLPAMVS